MRFENLTISKLLKLFILVIALLSTTGCLKKRYKLNGKIDQEFLAKVKSIPANEEVIVTSGGGNIYYADEVALLFKNRDLSTVVKRYCVSACAEDILPSSKRITFANRPIIGFHHNSIMAYDLAKERNIDLSSCNIDSAFFQKEIYGWKNLSLKFWKETYNRLEPLYVEFQDKGRNCPKFIWKFKHEVWIPTSIQLRELWGLEFEGETCADEMDSCMRKVDAYWEKGKSVVIGDTPYISKGL